MATKVFDDMEAVLMPFEDPEDMMAKQQLIAEEIDRRMKAAEAQALVNGAVPGAGSPQQVQAGQATQQAGQSVQQTGPGVQQPGTTQIDSSSTVPFQAQNPGDINQLRK